MSPTPSISVLISGRGSNLQALIDKQSGYRIAAVISNKHDAAGLAVARTAGIRTISLERNEYPSLTAFKDAVLHQTLETKPDFVLLAGFMMVLHSAFIESFRGRLLNIHPSLLPLLPGLDTHERALQQQFTEHGATVHFVDIGVDTGPAIAQSALAINQNETATTLAMRVQTLEHKLYPWVTARLASRDIYLEALQVKYSPRARLEAEQLGFRLFDKSAGG